MKTYNATKDIMPIWNQTKIYQFVYQNVQIIFTKMKLPKSVWIINNIYLQIKIQDV